MLLTPNRYGCGSSCAGPVASGARQAGPCFHVSGGRVLHGGTAVHIRPPPYYLEKSPSPSKSDTSPHSG